MEEDSTAIEKKRDHNLLLYQVVHIKTTSHLLFAKGARFLLPLSVHNLLQISLSSLHHFLSNHVRVLVRM